MISVVIPVYNGEKFIGAAIDSVSRQDVDCKVEILVCDDGSTDNSAQIIRDKMQNTPGLKLFQLGVNQGVCAARNRLLREISPLSKFVTFLDADDIFFDNIFKKNLQILLDTPEIQMTFGTLQIVPSAYLDGGCQMTEKWPIMPAINLAVGLYRTDLLRQIGAFDVSFTQGEDIDYLLRISEVCDKIHLHDQPTVYYRRHANNVTLNYAAMQSGFMRAILLHNLRRKADPSLFNCNAIFRRTDPALMKKAFDLYVA